MPPTSATRSILTGRRDQIHAMDNVHDLSSEPFQRHVADLFTSLDNTSSDILSISWIEKLLKSFLLIQEEFQSILLENKSILVSKSPSERLVTDFFDRSVKALDVCNAVRDGIDQVRGWKNCLEIIAAAIEADHKRIGEGQVLRAKKALTELTILMLNDKEVAINSAVSQRNRSFGRFKNHRNSLGGQGFHARSLSWSVSRNWSASRQLLMMNANLNTPRGNDVAVTNGLAIPIYMMNLVVLFVMWALVAAIPCQDRGLSVNFSVSRQFVWSGCLVSLNEKILEESKKRERKNANGLLREIGVIEKCMRNLNELIDNHEWPMGEEKEREIRAEVDDLRGVCGAFKDGLDSLERQVRQVFHRIVRNRTEGLDCIASNSE